MRTNILILLCLGTSLGATLIGCGDKDTGTIDPADDTGDTDDTDTDTGEDTGDTDEPVTTTCTYLGTTPATVPIESEVSLTVHMSCEDPEGAASTGWTYTLGGQELEAIPEVIGDEVVLTVEGLSTVGLLEGTEVSSLAADNPIFQAPAGVHNNVLSMHRPSGDWTTDIAQVHSQALSVSGLTSPILDDFNRDGYPDIVGLSCGEKTCELGLSFGDGGAFETWEWKTISTRTGATDELALIAGMGTEVLVFFGQDGGGEVIRVGVGEGGFGDAKSTDIATELDRYGFAADTVIDAVPVQGKSDTSFAVLLSGATKGGSACDDDDDFAIWDPDGSVSIFQGPVTCDGLADGTAVMGLTGGPGSGDIVDMDELVVWGATVEKETWDVFTWFDRDAAPTADDGANFSATLPGVSAEDLWLTTAGDLNDDGYTDLFLTAFPEGSEGYMAIIQATSEKSWGTPSWLTLDGDTTGSGPVHVLRDAATGLPTGKRDPGSGRATGVRQHKPFTVRGSIDSSTPGTATVFLTVALDEDRSSLLGASWPDLDLKAERNGGATFGVSSLSVYVRNAPSMLVVGGGSAVVAAEDPTLNTVGDGELMLFGQGTIGGSPVLSRVCTPEDAEDASCDTVLARLGEDSSISISGGSILFEDSSQLDLFSGSNITVGDALLLGNGGLRRKGDVTLIRRSVAPAGDLDAMEIIAVEAGVILGSAQITHTDKTSTSFDWSGSAQAFTGAGGGNWSDSSYWYAVSTEWLSGVSTDGGTVLTGIDLDDLISAAESNETLDLSKLGTSVLIGEEVSAEPLPGPRVVGGWLDAPYTYVPEATAVGTVRDGPGITADVIAVVGSKGTACPWRTVLIPGMDEDVETAMDDMIELSTSELEDCSDLETPILAADVLGSGGQQIYTTQWDGDEVTLAFYFRQDATIYRHEHKPVKIMKRIDKSSPLMMSAGNLNGDAFQDLYLDAFVDDLGGPGVWLSDGGRFSEWDTPMEVPYAEYLRGFDGFSATNASSNSPDGGMEMSPLMPGVQELRQE
ncbi:MAG: hypothetical protein ACI8RZ_001123 [Myxococcota bacterium]|jgi:hypothetical protein